MYDDYDGKKAANYDYRTWLRSDTIVFGGKTWTHGIYTSLRKTGTKYRNAFPLGTFKIKTSSDTDGEVT